MRLETCIRKAFGLKSQYVVRIEETAEGFVATLERLGRRLLCCGSCGLPCRRIHSRGQNRRWRDLSLRDKPLWLSYRPHRVDCPRCGIRTEKMIWTQPWARVTRPLARAVSVLARQMSWKEVAAHFRLNWKTVASIVRRAVAHGLAVGRRKPLHVIGIDEVSRKKGHQYLTLVYDLERGELLWIGQDRKEETLEAFFTALGRRRCRTLRTVCMDMWQPYLNAVQRYAAHATIVFDRFHVVGHLNDAVDQVRRQQWRKASAEMRGVIKGSRYLLLKNPWNHTRKELRRLREVIGLNQPLLRAYVLKEDFQLFWEYRQQTRALAHLQRWYGWARRSRLDPLKEFAGMVKRHWEGICAWTKLRISNGALEGMNNKVKLVSHRSFGFRNPNNYMAAIYHCCAHLPLP